MHLKRVFLPICWQLVGSIFFPKSGQMLHKKGFLAQNLATWATLWEVLLHKNLRNLLFLQELNQELKVKPGTNSETKKSQELTQ